MLHSLENVLIVFASRLVYLQESYPLGIVIFDCVLVLLNLMGVSMSVFYVSKIELYAGLPQENLTLSSFGPEVSSHMHLNQVYFLRQRYTYQFVFRMSPLAR